MERIARREGATRPKRLAQIISIYSLFISKLKLSPLIIKEHNYLGIAWSSGVFQVRIVEDDMNSKRTILFKNIKGDTLATFEREDVSTYPSGIIEKNKIIYDTQMVKGKYKPKGQLMVENNIIIDNYYIEKEHRTERLYIDWSGKPYAEE